jgi:hypothetical protein
MPKIEMDPYQEIVGDFVGQRGLIQEVPIVEVCVYRFHGDNWGSYWESGCNDQIAPMTYDDDEGPLQWGWRYCPSCRMPIVQRRGDG